jgi:hypothetical protein
MLQNIAGTMTNEKMKAAAQKPRPKWRPWRKFNSPVFVAFVSGLIVDMKHLPFQYNTSWSIL